MYQIQLSPQLFLTAQQLAAENGFASVDEFVEVVLQDEFQEGLQVPPNMDHFFTPERLVEIDAAVAQADQGLCMTREQSAAYLAEKRQAWLDQRKA